MTSFSGLSPSPEDVINFLKQEIRFKEVYEQILFRRIIVDAAQEREITVTSEEIQAEADRQRYAKRIETAAATFAWLTSEMVTPEQWEIGIYHQLLRKKLATFLFAQETDRYFAEHRLDFERVLLYRIAVPYEQVAQELFYQIQEEEISFFEAAHFYDIDEQRRFHCGYEGKLPRWGLKPDIAAIVFAARPGEVLRPIRTEHSYDLLMVETFIAAELTAEVRQQIVDQLFEEWLVQELNYLIHNGDVSSDSSLNEGN